MKQDQILQNTEDLLAGIDKFCKAMKDRVIEKSKEGQYGWNECSKEHAEYQIANVAKEIPFNPKKSVDVANWCAIHYINENK